MPLLGKKLYKPNSIPKDLKAEEEVFVIKETNEVFRSYDEYVNRIILYGFQVWSCQLTGKTNLKYAEAVACEQQALRKLESFPKYFEKPVLQIVHHSSSGLQTLAQQCYKYLENEFFENEPVECCVSGKWYPGRISRVHHRCVANTGSENIASGTSSPSSDKENSKLEKPRPVLGKNPEAQYDIKCDQMPDCLKDVLPGDIKRVRKPPSVEMLKCFIRANTENPWTHDNSPWLVKTDLVKKFSLLDKLNDFSLVISKITTPKSKTPTITVRSCEKAKKKLLDNNMGHSKPKGNKTDPSQRKLDSFRKSTGNISKTKEKTTTSSVKLSQSSLLKTHTPVMKDCVEDSSSSMDDGKTPSGQLCGTPVKCRLVLTPVKSPYRVTGKSPAQKGAVDKRGTDTKPDVVIVDDTKDSCKSPKKKISQSVKKLKSPKSAKSKKTLGGKESKTKEKLVKDAASKILKSDVIECDVEEREHGIKTTESDKKAKATKTGPLVKRVELEDLPDGSDNEFVSSPKKLKVSITPIKLKPSTGKMKQTTLLDLTKKPEEEKTSPKIKAKKQKTLAEMFSAALQKDKPRALNALIKKTAQEVSSPSSLALNLPTPQRDHVVEKLIAHKERLKWKAMGEEEKAKIKLEKIKLHRQLNGKVLDKEKQEDNKLVNLKPLPPAKPVNIPDGITAESYSDVAMIAEFVHTFRDLLLPKETLHITIDNLSEALVTGHEGSPLLSRILLIFLQILVQNRSTKKVELGMQLSEIPLTQQSASEVAQLYLSSNLKTLTAYAEDKQLQGILESLRHEEFYNHTPEEKLKILGILCHEVLSSDALDDYMGSQFAEATELRKQKMAKQKQKNDQRREEKERLKKEKEELQKQKEEEESKKQLKMDDLSKKETESSCINSEAASANPTPDNSSKTSEQKASKEAAKSAVARKGNEEVSEVVKVLRSRREDMANKREQQEKEKLERLEKEEEEQWNINMAHFQYTLRLKPIGYDRNHARYWVFYGIAAGVYVEQGWGKLEGLSQQTEEDSKEVDAVEEFAMETEGNEQTPIVADDVEVVGETKDESNQGADEKHKVQELLRLPDVPYSWSCYETVEEIQALLESLSHQGIRESALRKTLKEQMEAITDGIAIRNSYRKPMKPDEGGHLSSIKKELKETAEGLVHGNLAIISEGLEEYQQTVEQASSISDLARQLEKLLPSVLPQFCQGIFAKDKAGSEEAKECWLEEVKKATTVPRLHLLLGILDSTVIWDLSAENARCKVCRLKGLGKTLILCDDCNLGFHLQCLRPALDKVPEGHWSCPVCKPNERQSSRASAKNYKEESCSDEEDEEDEASEASLGDSEDSSEESDEHEDYCHTCGEDGDLICCDTCPLVFHTVCHQPPLRNIPRGAWNCWQCRQPKNKKQKKNLRGKTAKSKAAKNKAVKRARGDKSSQTKSKRKRSRSLSSEESGYQKASKRTRQTSTRGRARASIEDLSDDESNAGKTRACKSRKRAGKQAVVRNDSVLSRLRRRYQQESDAEENQDTNVKSFYGRSTRRTRQQKVSDDDKNSARNIGRASRRNRRQMDSDEDDNDDVPLTQRRNSARNAGRRSRRSKQVNDDEDDDLSDEDVSLTQRKNSARNAGRRSRRNKHQTDDDEDDDLSDEDVSLTRRRTSARNCGRGSRRNRRQMDNDDDDDDDVSSTQRRNSARNPGRGSRRNRRQILDSEDEDEEEDDDSERGEKQNHKPSQRKNSRPSKVKPAERFMSQLEELQAIFDNSSSSQESDGKDEDFVPTSCASTQKKTNSDSEQVVNLFSGHSTESNESGCDTSKAKKQARSKSEKGSVKGQTQELRESKSSHEGAALNHGKEKDSSKKIANEEKPKNDVLKSSSASKDGEKETECSGRDEVTQEDAKDKRRRVNVEMDACEHIVRELILNENSWPFTEAVNLREVPDYLELITTPMDLGTIRDKLKSLEYPDVESFVADVRLVFSNSDKYNLDTSEVGKAGKNLEKHFDKLLKQKFSTLDKKSKVPRKR